ncbi:MAG: hypothetical protein WDM91_13565 [Rhizomicrobium sp.]
MTCVGQFVADGVADWDKLDNGDIRLRFNTGETFLLSKTAIIRLGEEAST